MRIHTDERRTAYCDLFNQPDGDTNLFIVNPGQRTCWHRHERQTDQFRVLSGTVRFQKILHGVRSSAILTSPHGAFTVQPGWWHGYENIGQEPAYLLMYLDRKYDPTDEERAGEDIVPWDETCDYCTASTSRCQCGSEKTEIDY